ncbi:Hsp20/alpha crystallin family protein [Evansella tamaricis]|uniref:Hsp20/alpha crystallin family protein n=1 Tax=Evansella tamaricis TaxID=2069301 RepID=A0ABS6JGI8_9BACI|nr:Hsp20/alpha crystallin family protein [Evansella tamaricis]MBU9712329.1 Hsp20/alpha crystallin family protein [Evansella tamaricis]
MFWNKFDPVKHFLPKLDDKKNMTNGIDTYVQNMLSQYLGNIGNPLEEQAKQDHESSSGNGEETSANNEQVHSSSQQTDHNQSSNQSFTNNNSDSFISQAEAQATTNNQAFPAPSITPQTRIIEIHGFIIIQILIPKHIDINDIDVQHDSTKVVIKGFPTSKPFEIKLPDLVRKKASRAIYKKNILEIRLLKHEDEYLHSIPIRRK